MFTTSWLSAIISNFIDIELQNYLHIIVWNKCNGVVIMVLVSICRKSSNVYLLVIERLTIGKKTMWLFSLSLRHWQFPIRAQHFLQTKCCTFKHNTYFITIVDCRFSSIGFKRLPISVAFQFMCTRYWADSLQCHFEIVYIFIRGKRS